MNSCVSVGRITGLFGNNGELTVKFLQAPTEFNIEEPLFVEIDKLVVPLFVSSFRRKGQNGGVVVFDDIDTKRRAEEFIGLDILLPQELQVPQGSDQIDQDEFYLDDLVGFAFQAGEIKGAIVEFMEHELNPLFLVTVGRDECYIPAVDDFIESIDERLRVVHFSLPEGLLDINNE